MKQRTIVTLMGLALLRLLGGCSGAQKPQPHGCEVLDYGVLSATCGGDTDECNRVIDEHIEACAAKIRGGQ